jgi:hypothetical protein
MSACEWFAQCDNESVAVVTHPTLGDVEICEPHLAWLCEDLHDDGSPNPTKMVPPIVARSHGRIAAAIALLDGDDEGEL